MKKPYQKPALIKEEFTPEGALAACNVPNNNPSAPEQCSYTLDIVDIEIFAKGWDACNQDGTSFNYCTMAGPNNVFTPS